MGSDVDAARGRIYEHSLKLEDARSLAGYGANSRVAKLFDIHQEDLGPIFIVLIRRHFGF